ncbi:complement resistance protein TraT, partial [uncultured Cetobacterium sp.]|uniref:complement resistance protein TraT n=1 Tax=uncultured Cetobacterium sp. TaxID=527638 RepID=UPI00260593FC
MKKKLLLPLILLIGLLVTSCSSLDTVIRKRNLATQTKLSETIWLNPENINSKTIFIQIKNTSTNNIQIENQIRTVLLSKGYKITSNPKNANYWLQANILNLEKMNENQTNAAFNALAGAGVGATLGA